MTTKEQIKQQADAMATAILVQGKTPKNMTNLESLLMDKVYMDKLEHSWYLHEDHIAINSAILQWLPLPSS